MCVFYNDLVIESVGTKVKKKGENLGTQLQGKIHPRDYTKTLARIFDKYHQLMIADIIFSRFLHKYPHFFKKTLVTWAKSSKGCANFMARHNLNHGYIIL